MKRLIKTIPYDEINFRWVCDHYDVHLNGTCALDGKLCEFKGEYPDWNDETNEYDTMVYEIYSLSFWDKIKWRHRQWLFETCVGSHYTYPERKPFYYRNSVHQLLFQWYFRKS